MAGFKDLKYCLIIFYGVLQILGSEGIKYKDITASHLENCMKYEKAGIYELFIPLNKSSKKIAADEVLHLNFYLMNETDDGQILLAKNAKYDTEESEYYKIQIACKTFPMGIKVGSKWSVKIEAIPNIFSDVGPTQVEIIQKKNGTLLVFVPSYSNDPLFQYQDPSPLEINYFSLFNYSSTGTWFHSCPFDNLGDENPASTNDICDCQNGFCATPGNCTCHPGFILSNSNKSYCDPICLDGCPNGFCYSPGKCACNIGYYKSNNNLCEPVCRKGCFNGYCIAPGKCACNKGYYKTNDNLCEPVCKNGCANGFCSAPQKCTCSDGYQWSDKKCEPVCTDGCPNGYCRYPGLCFCNNGFLWNANKCQLV